MNKNTYVDYEEKKLIKHFSQIPGVGKSMSKDLIDLGFCDIKELKGQSAETMYQNLMKIRGNYIDRCVLYVFRCAIYFATCSDPDPELLKWWNHKDK